MDIAIGGIRYECRDQRVEIAGRYVLRGGPDHACGRERPSHRPAGRHRDPETGMAMGER